MLDPKLATILARVQDPLTPIAESEYNAWITEIKGKMRRVSTEIAVTLHYLLGRLEYRRAKLTEAADHFRIASQASVGVEKVEHLGRYGAVLLRLGRPQEALPLLKEIEATDDVAKSERCVINRGNLAEAHAMLGRREEALEWFQKALDCADFRRAVDLYNLACAAASLGLNRQAVELLARAIAQHNGLRLTGDAESFLREHNAAVASLTEPEADLARVVAQELRFRGVLSRLRWRPASRGEGDGGEEARRVFAAMTPLRRRANVAVLPSVPMSVRQPPPESFL
jgi:tetratricopeptide (TPR) repeat protein